MTRKLKPIPTIDPLTNTEHDLAQFKKTEIGGAFPQVDLINRRDPEAEIQTVAKASGTETRILTRASCGSNIVPRHVTDLKIWARGMAESANSNGQALTYKVFDAQNNPDEFIPLLEILNELKAEGHDIKIELALTYSNLNSDEYMQEKAVEYAKVARKYGANTVSLKSMIGDLEPAKAAKLAAVLAKALEEEYADIIASQYIPTKQTLTEMCQVAPRDDQQSKSANRAAQTAPEFLNALKKIKEIVASYPAEKKSPLPTLALHCHNPTGKAAEANAAWVMALKETIFMPSVDISYDATNPDYQAFSGIYEFEAAILALGGPSLFTDKTRKHINEMNTHFNAGDKAYSQIYSTESGAIKLPGPIAALIGVPGGGKAHTVKYLTALAQELGKSPEQIEAGYIKIFSVLRGVDINDIYALADSGKLDEKYVSEVIDKIEAYDVSDLIALDPERKGILPGYSTVTPGYSYLQTITGIAISNRHKGKSGRESLSGINDTMLRDIRKNKFPGGAINDANFKFFCQEFIDRIYSSTGAKFAELKKDIGEEKAKAAIEILKKNITSQDIVTRKLISLGMPVKFIAEMSAEVGVREYILAEQEKPVYQENLEFFQEKAKKHGISLPCEKYARLAITLDVHAVWDMYVNGRWFDPRNMSTKEVAERDAREYESRLARPNPDISYKPNESLLRTDIIGDAYIPGDEIANEDVSPTARRVVANNNSLVKKGVTPPTPPGAKSFSTKASGILLSDAIGGDRFSSAKTTEKERNPTAFEKEFPKIAESVKNPQTLEPLPVAPPAPPELPIARRRTAFAQQFPKIAQNAQVATRPKGGWPKSASSTWVQKATQAAKLGLETARKIR